MELEGSALLDERGKLSLQKLSVQRPGRMLVPAVEPLLDCIQEASSNSLKLLTGPHSLHNGGNIVVSKQSPHSALRLGHIIRYGLLKMASHPSTICWLGCSRTVRTNVWLPKFEERFLPLSAAEPTGCATFVSSSRADGAFLRSIGMTWPRCSTWRGTPLRTYCRRVICNQMHR